MDDLSIITGRRILTNARGDLSQHLSDQEQLHRGMLDRAVSDIDGAATYVTVNGQAVLNDARKSLDNRVNLILGHAMQTAGLFGVEVPHPNTLRTSRSFPPPEIVAIGTGTQAPPAALSIGDGGGGGYRPICQVHLVEASIRPAYVWLCRQVDKIISVCPEPVSFIGGELTKIRRYPHWWCAELACRLVNECRWPLDEVLSYSDAIDAVQLFDGSGGVDMHEFCSVLPRLFDEWRAWIHHGLSQTAKPGEIHGIVEGQVLPEGYCWWCDASGAKHVYPCEPETYPAGWKRC